MTDLVEKAKETALEDAQGWWTQVKEISVLWLEELAGDLFPNILHAVDVAVDEVEHKASDATKGLAKENIVFDALWPQIEAALQAKLGMFGGLAARFTVIPKLKNGLRGLIQEAVKARNTLFTKGWKDIVHGRVTGVVWKVENLTGMDLTGDDIIGDPAAQPPPA